MATIMHFLLTGKDLFFPKYRKSGRKVGVGAGLQAETILIIWRKGFSLSLCFFGGESRFNLVADVAISGEQAGSASGLTVPDKRSAPS